LQCCRYEHVSFEDGGCVAGAAFVPEGLWPETYKYLFIDFVFLKVFNLQLNMPERQCTMVRNLADYAGQIYFTVGI
jgi:hypothetical protein